jgi:hypothetical protein
MRLAEWVETAAAAGRRMDVETIEQKSVISAAPSAIALCRQSR